MPSFIFFRPWPGTRNTPRTTSCMTRVTVRTNPDAIFGTSPDFSGWRGALECAFGRA